MDKSEIDIKSTGQSIAAVEQETGLSKDLLRVWERRYGFPSPHRTLHGERLYSEEQVAKLRVLRRLVDRGLRPGKILGLSMPELQALSGAEAPVQRSAPHDLAMHLLATHQAAALRRELTRAVMRNGMYRFVTETAAPLSELVGDAWMRGEIRVFEEHLFTEILQGVMRGAIARMPASAGPPRVLLTTLPGEQHGLGLLMAEAVLALEEADCLSLGIQTPVGDVVAAAAANKSDIVAVSFSGNYPAGQMSDSLQLLRSALPPDRMLWCGGSGATRAKQLPEGCRRIDGLDGISEALGQWRISLGARGWRG